MEIPQDPSLNEKKRQHLQQLIELTEKKRSRLLSQKRAPTGPEAAQQNREIATCDANLERYRTQLFSLDSKYPDKSVDHDRAVVQREIEIERRRNDGEASLQDPKRSTETLGEIGAREALRDLPELRDRYKDYTLVQGFEKQGEQGVDQVYRDCQGNVLIVEAKGGSSSLNQTVNDGRQMSYDWVKTRSERNDPAGNAISEAFATGKKVEGLTLKTKNANFGNKVKHSPHRAQKRARGIEDIDPETGIINYTKTHRDHLAKADKAKPGDD